MRKASFLQNIFAAIFLSLPFSFIMPFPVHAYSVEDDAAIQKEMVYAMAFEQAQHLSPRQRILESKTKKSEEKKLPLQIEGYYKNLLVFSKTTDTEEGFFSDLSRLRLGAKLDISSKLKTNVIFDQEAIIGDFAKTSSFDAIRNRDQKSLVFLDGDKAYTDKEHIYAKYSLYRAYLEYYDPNLQASAGKQLIDWGRCRFFSPMDLFNPISPLQIEREERIGVDALNFDVALTSLSSFNLVFSPQRKAENSSLGSRLYYRMENFDLFFAAGEFRKNEVVGFCFDGYMGNGGIRGEFTQTHADGSRDYLRGVIGAEYNFPNKIYVLGEYFYNGGAESNFAQFLDSYQFSSKALSLKKNLFGLWIGYEITPLLKWDNYAVYDFDQKSVFINPELRYNLRQNLDVSAGIQFFRGNSDSEFGNYQDVYYLQAKYFF